MQKGVILFLFLAPLSAFTESVTIPEPTLSPNAQKYDEEHPENLDPVRSIHFFPEENTDYVLENGMLK